MQLCAMHVWYFRRYEELLAQLSASFTSGNEYSTPEAICMSCLVLISPQSYVRRVRRIFDTTKHYLTIRLRDLDFYEDETRINYHVIEIESE